MSTRNADAFLSRPFQRIVARRCNSGRGDIVEVSREQVPNDLGGSHLRKGTARRRRAAERRRTNVILRVGRSQRVHRSQSSRSPKPWSKDASRCDRSPTSNNSLRSKRIPNPTRSRSDEASVARSFGHRRFPCDRLSHARDPRESKRVIGAIAVPRSCLAITSCEWQAHSDATHTDATHSDATHSDATPWFSFPFHR